METCKAIIREALRAKKSGLQIIKQVLVPSKSVPGDYHLVRVYEDNSIDCDCVGFGLYQENCGHIKRVQEMIKNKEV